MTEGKDDSHDDAAGHAAVPPPGRRLPAATQGVCLLIFAGALAALLFFFPALISLAAPQDAGEDQPPGSFKPTAQQWAGLKVERVISRDFAPRVETEGRIALDDDYSTPIFSPYSGRVTRVMAKAGDRVTAGSPLFAIQSNELAQAENDMISGLATLKTARAQLDLASANELRQHALYLGHGAALKDWQQSRVDLATAEGGLRTAEIAVSAVRSRLAILGLNRADIDAVESAPDPEHLNADSIVRSPIAGTVTQRAINPGQNIVGNVTSQGNAGSVYTIGNLSRLWMIGNARETDAPLFHVGDVTEVHVPAFPDRTFVARISYVAPIIDPNTHRLLVRADIANADLALKPDMLASFVILTGAPAPSLAVPENAIVYEGSDAHVFLADPKTRTLAIRNIVVGEDIGGLVEVERGLTAADSVVTSGAVFIDRALSGGS